MNLGQTIRNYRLFRKMTQEELAAKLNKSKSVISHWEKGENSPDLDSCQALCCILEITPNELFEWHGAVNADYSKHLKRLEVYQQKISELVKQKAEIDKQIHELEVKKFEEAPPTDFM